MIHRNPSFRALVVVVAVISLLSAGCGTNKFEQEVQTEEAAIKLTNETIDGDYQLISTAETEKTGRRQKELLIDRRHACQGQLQQGTYTGCCELSLSQRKLWIRGMKLQWAGSRWRIMKSCSAKTKTA